MAVDRETWLSLTKEESLEPDLPICDPHYHLWDMPGDRYLLGDLLKDTSGQHNVRQIVFVEHGSTYRSVGPEQLRPVGETEFAERVAAESAGRSSGRKIAVAAGIVGFANLTLGAAVGPVLDAHMAASRDRFRGIRHVVAWEASPLVSTARGRRKGLMYDTKFREGLACLQEHGLSFDAWAYHTQLTELADLAQAFPRTSFIMNHTCGPLGVGPYAGRRDEVFQEWKEGIAALSTCRNTVIKLGGLGIPAAGFGWHERPTPPGSAEVAEATAPYFRWCIEKFGADRCMFESNFPADKRSYSYNVVWNAFKLVTADYSPGERAALFHDTAVRAYRLPAVN